jgi:hypothetical protein
LNENLGKRRRKLNESLFLSGYFFLSFALRLGGFHLQGIKLEISFAFEIKHFFPFVMLDGFALFVNIIEIFLFLFQRLCFVHLVRVERLKLEFSN